MTETRSRATDVATPDELDRLLRRAVARLGDGHARLVVPGASVVNAVVPFALRETREGPVVTRAHGGEVPAVGDLWLELDGEPVRAVLERELELAFGSTPSGRRRRAWTRARGVASPTCEATFLTPAGERRTVTLAAALSGTLEDPRDREEPWRLERPRADVAVLRCASFAPRRWAEWKKTAVEGRDAFLAAERAAIDGLFRELAETPPRALVIDLRGNGGGTDLLGIRLAQHLVDGRFRYFLLSESKDGAWTRPGGLVYEAEEGMAPWRGPVVALIDGGCFSTTDNLLRCLDDLHPDFATVGRPTGGGTGAPREIVTLPGSGARVTLCTQRVYGPGGELIEGRGTRPDVEVEWTRADVIEGRDPDLAAALALVDARR